MRNEITCPQCQTSIEVTEVLSVQLAADIRAEVEADVSHRRQELEERNTELRKLEVELAREKSEVAAEVAAQLTVERKRIAKEERAKAAEDLHQELQASNKETQQLRDSLKAAKKVELEYRRREQELVEQKESLELEVARKLDEERAKIRSTAMEQADEQHRLKVAEKEQLIQQMQKQIDDLRRKSEQGSQQIQGEVLEVELEDTLVDAFPADEIVAVPKGQNGGDVQQKVCTASGRPCGTILWESKRTKNFSRQWLPKLRDDQRKSGADCAVIVTEALPNDVKTVAQIDGVWICSRAYAVTVGMALRAGIIQVSKARIAADGRNEKSDQVYSYLCSQEFTHHLSGIVEAFTEMLKDLDSEERSAKTRFRKRRKQLERGFTGTASMYGDLQGLIGNAMPEIRNLEFDDDSDMKALAS